MVHYSVEKGEKCVTKFFGESNPANVLSEDAVKLIKAICVPGDGVLGIRNISKAFGVHRKTVYNIVHGNTWSQV